MKHYGIWVYDHHNKEVGWMVNGEGEIFWTTGLGVAKAMLERLVEQHSKSEYAFEIREFEE